MRAREDDAQGGGRAGSPGHPAPCSVRAWRAGLGRGGARRLGPPTRGALGEARAAARKGKPRRPLGSAYCCFLGPENGETLPGAGCAAHRVRRAPPDAEPSAPGSPLAARARPGWPQRAPGPERACAWADKGGAEGSGGCPAGLKVAGALFPNSLQVTFPFLTPCRPYSSRKPSMYLGRRLHPRSPKNWVPIRSR